MATLADEGHTVLLETDGAEEVSAVDPRVHIIMDLKRPIEANADGISWPIWTF